jgi:hypothetical protein
LNFAKQYIDIFSSLLPSAKSTDSFMLQLLSLLQKYGVIITILVFLMCMVFRYIAKIRKNTRVQQFFLMLGFGMITLCILLIFLPYVVLHFMQQ